MRDLDTLTSWHSDWLGVRVAVLGLGVTGFAVADTLVELGAAVVVVAERATSELLELSAVIGAPAVLAPGDSVPTELSSFGAEIAIVSPGVPADHPWIRFLRDAGVPIWGDVELGWRLRDKAGTSAEWLLVTGGEGHVLASSVAEHVLVSDGYRVIAVGANGIPLLDAIRDPVGYEAIIVCLSPAQLQWVPREGAGALMPAASACTVSRDLSDIQLSQVATIFFGTKIACLYNTGDTATMRMVEEAEVQEGCRAIGFGLGAPGPSDLGVVDGIVVDRAFHDDRRTTALELTTRGELALLGLSSVLDATSVLVGAGFARLCGVPADAVSAHLSTFTRN
jgi:UDP-N-acetylmuramoylalanine--D-glutamate ligase